jgi:tetratricopeptide (TPR) repeat protein
VGGIVRLVRPYPPGRDRRTLDGNCSCERKCIATGRIAFGQEASTVVAVLLLRVEWMERPRGGRIGATSCRRLKKSVGCAIALAYQGKRDEAITAFREAGHVDPQKGRRYDRIARLLASSPDANLRDGKAAVEFATKACELTEWKSAYYLDTLAAALAEAGDFNSAVRRQTEAIALLTDARQKEDFGKRLKLYQDRKPL